MKSLIKFLLDKFGVHLKKSIVIDLRGKVIHPLELVYQAEKTGVASSILINIPVSKCRTQLWNTLENKKNPFVKTIIEYNDCKTLDYNSTDIKVYYENFQPESAAAFLRLERNETLKEVPAYGYLLPWDTQNINDTIKIRKRVALNENKKEGIRIGLSSGHTDFGPVSNEKGQVEFKRLTNVFEKIKENGYKEKPNLPDGGIKGYFLIGESGDWCFIIKSGKHRAYSLAALGFAHIPVIVETNIGIIKRLSDLPYWPQVKNEIFSEQEANLLFNNILNIENQI